MRRKAKLTRQRPNPRDVKDLYIDGFQLSHFYLWFQPGFDLRRITWRYLVTPTKK